MSFFHQEFDNFSVTGMTFFGNRNEKNMSKISLLNDIFARQIFNVYNMGPTATKVFHASSLFYKWINKVDVNHLVIATRLVTGILYCFAVNTSYSSLYHMILNWVQNVQYLHKNKTHMIWHIIVNLPFFTFTEGTEIVAVNFWILFTFKLNHYFVIFQITRTY